MPSRIVRSAGFLALAPALLLSSSFLPEPSPLLQSARPTCDAGPAISLECTGPVMQVQLDGTASTGGGLTYRWAGCGDDAFTLSDPTSPTPILTVDMTAACSVDCELTLTVSNSSGKSRCSTFVHVGDTIPPVLTCPSDLLVILGDPTDPSATGMATATDACNPTPTVTWTDDLSGLHPQGTGTILRTWTATDGCQSSSCLQTIEVALEVHFQLFPEYCPNELIVSGTSADGDRVTATILGNAIDVTQVNLSSVSLVAAGNFDAPGVQPINIAFADLSSPDVNLEICACTLPPPDGKMDLFLEFDAQEVIQAFGLAALPSGTEFPVNIKGDLSNSEVFNGDDCFLLRAP